MSSKKDKTPVPQVHVAPDNIPQELKDLKQWVVWKYETRGKGEKPTKVPYNAATHGRGKSNDSSTWSSFNKVLKVYQVRERYSGVGFAFCKGDGLFGVDLDHCVKDGQMTSAAKEIVARFSHTYCEFSPSGKGLRIFGRGKAERCGKGTNEKWVELYDASSSRYLTVTGNHVKETAQEISDCSEALLWLHETFFKKPGDRQRQHDSYESEQIRSQLCLEEGRSHTLTEADNKLLEKAKEAKNGEKFQILYSGKWEGHYPSQSEADLALLLNLAFWSKSDPERMDRIFRSSGLMRPKWDEKHDSAGATYGVMSIMKAIELQADTFDGWAFELPYGYKLSERGVGKICEIENEKDGEKSTKVDWFSKVPTWIDAYVESIEGYQQGLLIRWRDVSGRYQMAILRESQITTRRDTGIPQLRDRGLKIRPKKEGSLVEYYGEFNPQNCILVVEEMIARQVRDEWLWALPYAVFREKSPVMPLVPIEEAAKRQDVRGFWSPSAGSSPYKALQFQELPDVLNKGAKWRSWQDGLKKLTRVEKEDSEERKRAIAIRMGAICASLYAVVRPLFSDVAGFDGFCLHFHGQSGSGKSTLTQLGASMSGNGGRCGSPNSLLKSFNGTARGLEAEASTYEGAVYALDELTPEYAKNKGEFIYNLVSGEGRARAKRDGSLQQRSQLQKVALSSGEISLEEALSVNGVALKEGQAVRMIEVAVGRWLFDGKKEADEVSEFASTQWGYAHAALLLEVTKDINKTCKRMQELHRKIKEEFLQTLGELDATQQRLMDRFVVMAAIGEFCAELGILPWCKAYTTRAMVCMFEYVTLTRTMSEEVLAISRMRDAILAKRWSHFDNEIPDEPEEEDDDAPWGEEMGSNDDSNTTSRMKITRAQRERWGIYKEAKDEIWIYPFAVTQLSGSGKKLTVNALRQFGLLREGGEKDRITSREYYEGERTPFYVVTFDIFAWEPGGNGVQDIAPDEPDSTESRPEPQNEVENGASSAQFSLLAE